MLRMGVSVGCGNRCDAGILSSTLVVSYSSLLTEAPPFTRQDCAAGAGYYRRDCNLRVG
jgi:hypothetical protein